MSKLAYLLKVIRLLCCSPKITWVDQCAGSQAKVKVDVIIGIEFGHSDRPRVASVSNSRTATIIDGIREKDSKLPFWAQQEVLNLISKKGDTFALPKNKMLSLWEVFAELREKYPKWRTIALVTHPGNLWLCSRIAEKLEFELVVPLSVSSIPYDRRAHPRCVRSRGAYWVTTRIAAFQMLFKGVI